MADKKKKSVRLTAPQLAYLETEASRLGITVAELLRRIVDAWRETRAIRTAGD